MRIARPVRGRGELTRKCVKKDCCKAALVSAKHVVDDGVADLSLVERVVVGVVGGVAWLSSVERGAAMCGSDIATYFGSMLLAFNG